VLRRLSALHTAAVVSLAFSPCGSWLATGSRDRSSRVLGTSSWDSVATLAGVHAWSICAVAFHPRAPWLVLASQDCTVRRCTS
jgi:centriolar protein POC1